MAHSLTFNAGALSVASGWVKASPHAEKEEEEEEEENKKGEKRRPKRAGLGLSVKKPKVSSKLKTFCKDKGVVVIIIIIPTTTTTITRSSGYLASCSS